MKKRTRQILDILDEQYGTEYRCYLNYETPWQLLIATMLSAQCTDARVNIVTESLFKKYPSASAFASADLKVIRGNIYHEPSVVVDTHVKRISNRLGLTKNQDPEKIEQDLMKELPKDHWILYNIQIITFGRTICTARSPRCEECFLQKYCKEYKM